MTEPGVTKPITATLADLSLDRQILQEIVSKKV